MLNLSPKKNKYKNTNKKTIKKVNPNSFDLFIEFYLTQYTKYTN